MKHYDVIIIGAGCAGMTAGIYCRRAGKSVLILESMVCGGQITYSPKVENYPSIKAISGADFASHLYEQTVDLGAEFALEQALSVTDGEIKTVATDYSQYSASALIIATGLQHRKLGLPNEEKLIGNGISFCALCDGAFYKNKPVVVYGGANTAASDALFLSELCSEVTVVYRKSELRCEVPLKNALMQRSNVKYLFEHTITALGGEKSLSSVTVTDKHGNSTEIETTGLFAAIGQIPANDIFKGFVEMQDGYVLAGEDCRTSRKGVFAAGDCRTKQVRQLATAAADGAVAATNACSFADSLKIDK